MKRIRGLTFVLLVAGAALPVARAADHADSPAVTADPAADILDVYTWMSPDQRFLNLALDVARDAGPNARFSDAVQYVFHTSSMDGYGAAAETDVDVICQFDAAQTVECWAGDVEYLKGNAGSPGGIRTPNGRLRVHTGLHDDPFFFNLAGFRTTVSAVIAAAPGLAFDLAGCPALDAATSAALVTQLASAPGGGPPSDSFLGFNGLFLVVQVDRAIVTTGGPITAVWGATYRR